MIEVHLNPSRVEAVVFRTDNDLEEDFDLGTWVLIRPFVRDLDLRLRAAAEILASQDGAVGDEDARHTHGFSARRGR